MDAGRYYPTNVSSGAGEVFIFGGRDENEEFVTEVEVFNPTTGLSEWPTADRSILMYPSAHLMPDGGIFHTGPQQNTYVLNPTTQAWDFIDANNFGWRGTGTGDFHSVMLPPATTRS